MNIADAKEQIKNSVICVILAGGQSRRMGRDKAELPYSYEELKPMISAGSVNNTGVLRITTTNDSPAVATAITNALTDVVPNMR